MMLSARGSRRQVDLVDLRVFGDQGQGSFDWVDAWRAPVGAQQPQLIRVPHHHRQHVAGEHLECTTVPNWSTLEADFCN